MFDVLFRAEWRRARSHAARNRPTSPRRMSTEPFGQPFAVFKSTPNQIGRDADIQRAARPAREYVHPIAFHLARQHGLPGQAQQ